MCMGRVVVTLKIGTILVHMRKNKAAAQMGMRYPTVINVKGVFVFAFKYLFPNFFKGVEGQGGFGLRKARVLLRLLKMLHS